MLSPRPVALVTGAAKGIGRGIALRLAKDGFDVAINGRENVIQHLEDVAKEISALGGRRVYIAIADVSSDDQVKAMVDDVVKELGSLDVMVANAGVESGWKAIAETSVEEWDAVFATNARGTFLCYKYAARQMIAQGRGGRIIGACSITGKKGEPMVGPYSATKFAIRGLTQSAAIELAPYKITVNTYAPGIIDTPMLERIDEQSRADDFPGVLDAIRRKSVLGRVGQVEDIVGLVSYLASEESRFMTGQSILCDGGVNFD